MARPAMFESDATRRSRWIFKTARWALWLALACGAGQLLGGLGFRAGLWAYGTGISVLRWSATADLAAILLALVAVVAGWKTGHRGALGAGAFSLLVTLAVGAPAANLWRQVGDVPRIHDITTDTDNPPRFVAVVPLRQGANPLDVLPDVIAQQKKGYPDIAPVLLDATPVQAYERAEKAARALGWEIVAAVPGEGRIEATDTSLLFGFKDDIVIRVVAQGSGSRVDARSVSRVGRGDFGVNASRIRKFMDALK